MLTIRTTGSQVVGGTAAGLTLFNSPLLRTLSGVSLDFNHETGSKISVALSVLFVGGTGQISLTSVREAVAAGHRVAVFNRGKSSAAELPPGGTSMGGGIQDTQS